MWWNSSSVSEHGSTDNCLPSTDALVRPDLIKPAVWVTRPNKASWSTGWRWEEEAVKDRSPRVSSTESPPPRESTNSSSRETWDRPQRREWAARCPPCAWWTRTGSEKTEPTSSSKSSVWTPGTTPSGTTAESTGSATPSTSTGNSEDSPGPENRPEDSMSRDTGTPRLDPPRELTTREEIKFLYSDTDDFLFKLIL